jgi:hypothetical protein
MDYRFSIQDSDGKKIDLQSPHSGWGVESASYTFWKGRRIQTQDIYL